MTNKSIINKLNTINDKVYNSICKAKEVYISVLRDAPNELRNLTYMLTEIYNDIENLINEEVYFEEEIVNKLNVIYDRVDDSICRAKGIYISEFRCVLNELRELALTLTGIHGNIENLINETKMDGKDEFNN